MLREPGEDRDRRLAASRVEGEDIHEVGVEDRRRGITVGVVPAGDLLALPTADVEDLAGAVEAVEDLRAVRAFNPAATGDATPASQQSYGA